MICDDHGLIREGLNDLINEQVDMECVAIARNGKEVLDSLKSTHTDIVLMDRDMPIMNGLSATRLIKRTHPNTRVIGLSMHDSPSVIDAFIQAGASGYVMKDADHAELLLAIRTVFDNGTFLCKEAGRSMRKERKCMNPSSRLSDLAIEEISMLKLFGQGMGVDEIASELKLDSSHTRWLKSRLMSKLQAENHVQLVRSAVAFGLIS